jgi:predicted dehydrogenase
MKIGSVRVRMNETFFEESAMNEKIRAVMVGCGGIAGAWLDPCKEWDDLEIVGFVDLIEENARKRAEEYGRSDASVGKDLGAILDQTKPDAVFDLTVPEAHVDVTLAALDHGCHVMGEKPLADSMENARKMVAAAQEKGKTYSVIQNRRYDPNIRRLKSLLVSGKVGNIAQVNCDFYLGPHFGGFREEMDHVLLLDMAIHTFDAARLISGADPVSVYCKEWDPKHSWYKHGASAVAVFEMTYGVVYTYRGCWCNEGLPTTWESDWRISCDSGSVTWDGAEGFQVEGVVERVDCNGRGKEGKCEAMEVPPHDPATRIGGHGGVIREFLDCVKSGETPETTCTDNIKSLAMVFGAIESAETGKVVGIAV